jgi:crotonobetainyl-CoA:carnitine CoA-transferase CaiB-like acyl-CoA transferase
VQEWGAFVELGLQGTVVKLLKSPFRLSSRDVGPTFAAVRRGADNAAVLKGKLGMSDGEIQQLVAAGVLCSEGGDGDTRD